MSRHASHYTKPDEQKQIIRILLMPPIYAAVSMLSIHYYTKHVYFEVMRDCYEAFAISSFFTLLCNYITPDLHDQKAFFRTITPNNWVWPITWCQKCTGGETKGWLRKPASGLTWFNIIYVSIFQYCFIRVFFTLVSVATEHHNILCEDSLSPKYAYLWVLVFDSAAVTLAMYCLIQFYAQLKTDLAAHRPFLKLLSIKLVIFFCFWQNELLSVLSSVDVIKESKFLAYGDIEVALPNMLICIEMAFFAVMHVFAYPWKEYGVRKEDGVEVVLRVGMIRALAHALNPWDVVKAFARGCRWLFVGSRQRHLDPSYRLKEGGSIDSEEVPMRPRAGRDAV
ncbi:Transmembrane protein 184-like protein [Diplodia seriata]|uniref:Transmembrane protein 184-like protein n=1 Tax=Diplodia seriata TaxID=420778 RepID=A0A1S8BP30_9PEZI|nr:Transmembrane protein 184-like protein [Diplodia seriata]